MAVFISLSPDRDQVCQQTAAHKSPLGAHQCLTVLAILSTTDQSSRNSPQDACYQPPTFASSPPYRSVAEAEAVGHGGRDDDGERN